MTEHHDEGSPEPPGDKLGARVAALERAVAELQARLAASDVSAQVANIPSPLLAAGARPEAATRSDAAAAPARDASPSVASPGAPLEQGRGNAVDYETLIAGRWLNRIGLLAVAIGVSYFLKLAIDNSWVGPNGQVAFGLLLGVSLVASTPWFSKQGYGYFADGIAGLGATIIYLALWAGGQYYHLFSLGLTFGLMAATSGGIVAMAVVRDSQPLAMIALLGGFASPALAGSGQDAQTALFGYLAILNAALLTLAWLRRWRAIDLPALLLTHIYFWGWFSRFYSPARLFSTAAFAMIFFTTFLALPLVRARTSGSIHWEHRLLVPLNAYLLLAIGVALFWPDYRWTLTAATLLISASHLAAAQLVPAHAERSGARLLFGGVALTVATLAIPIRLNGTWITTGLSVEGAVLAWSGLQARIRSMRVLAVVLFVVAGLRTLSTVSLVPAADAAAILNARFMTSLTMLLCAGASLWLTRTDRDSIGATERTAYSILAVALNILAWMVLTAEVRVFFRSGVGQPNDALAEGLSMSLLWALYASTLLVAGLRQAIAALRWQALALFGITTWKVFAYDMAALNGIYRVASATVLGIVLLAVSFAYQRNRKPAQRANPA